MADLSTVGKIKKIKCVVWDLDNTLWDGVLLEDNQVKPRREVLTIIRILDERGILQSIASKNNYEIAMGKLEELGINEYFLYPQINWNSKSSSVKNIAQSLNIGINTFAFVDDQQFELDEVKFSIPEVRCINIEELDSLADRPDMIPDFITADSKNRRYMYLSDQKRKRDEEEFNGPQEEFLASLGMTFTISPVGEGDLERAEELSVRTNQLNSTGYTYSYDELKEFSKSNKYKVMIAALDDKYGTYGKIGLSLVECDGNKWTIKLLLMSCRVMSRGVGTVMLNYIMNLAIEQGATLYAEFVSNDRNRMMYITYKFAGFNEVLKEGDWVVFECGIKDIQKFPDYIKVNLIS